MNGMRGRPLDGAPTNGRFWGPRCLDADRDPPSLGRSAAFARGSRGPTDCQSSCTLGSSSGRCSGPPQTLEGLGCSPADTDLAGSHLDALSVQTQATPRRHQEIPVREPRRSRFQAHMLPQLTHPLSYAVSSVNSSVWMMTFLVNSPSAWSIAFHPCPPMRVCRLGALDEHGKTWPR